MNAKQRLKLAHITQKTLQNAAETATPDLESLAQVPVKIIVSLGESQMPIQDLLNLKKGSAITLNKKLGEPVDIYANDTLIGHGELTLADDHFGVILTEVV